MHAARPPVGGPPTRAAHLSSCLFNNIESAVMNVAPLRASSSVRAALLRCCAGRRDTGRPAHPGSTQRQDSIKSLINGARRSSMEPPNLLICASERAHRGV